MWDQSLGYSNTKEQSHGSGCVKASLLSVSCHPTKQPFVSVWTRDENVVVEGNAGDWGTRVAHDKRALSTLQI